MIMPITPNDCLLVMPFKDSAKRIIPPYVTTREDIAKNLSRVLVSCAQKEFLGDASAKIESCGEKEPNKIMQKVILSVAQITSDE